MKEYGGEWTEEKLEMLRKYLDAYTTALKKSLFHLIYIDAFAGPGYVPLKSGGVSKFIKGSPAIALDIRDRQFDGLLFNDLKEGVYAQLKERFDSEERVTVSKGDANEFLKNLNRNWKRCRGVLFIDPFATELNFSTLKEVASYEALDIWLLFPISDIFRLMPKDRRPESVNPVWADTLTRVFGGKNWEKAYKLNPQQRLPNKEKKEETEEEIREKGVQNILELYKEQLHSCFGDRLLTESKTLRTSKNSPLFEFIFCVGSKDPKAIGIAKNIARHIIKQEEKLPKASPEPPLTLQLRWSK